MKWVFICLLLLNLFYFGLELDQGIKEQVGRNHSLPAVPVTAKRLSLLKEMQTLPEEYMTTDSETLSLATNDLKPGDTLQAQLQQADIMRGLVAKEFGQEKTACFTYGPINGEEKTNELYDWLRGNNIHAGKREEYDKKEVMFWIYLAPHEDQQRASETLEDLKDKGITDYRLIRRGNFANAISLGLFSSKERVDIRLKELKGKGYKPVVVPYHDSGVKRIYWVDVMFDQFSGDFEHIINGVPKEYDSVPVDCSNIALAPLNP